MLTSASISAPLSKHTLVYATPRSGSTLFHKILANRQSEMDQTQDLEEFLQTLGKVWLRDSNGRLYCDPKIKMGHGSNWITSRAKALILEERVKWLRQNDRHCLKVFSGTIPTAHRNWFEHNYSWVFVERKNIFEQFLSFAIAFETQTWYGKYSIAPRSLGPVGPRVAVWLYRYLVRYHKQKARMPKAPVLVYEDYLAQQDPERVLRQCGLSGSSKVWAHSLPEKQSPEDKLSLFQDPKQVLRVYKKSPLQELHPIPIGNV